MDKTTAMKSILIVLLSSFSLFAIKEKPVSKFKSEWLGEYYKADGGKTKEWTVKPMPNSENRMEFWHNDDKDYVFTVVMKDSTHFKSPGEFPQEAPGQGVRYWSAKGEFLPDGKMLIAVRNSEVSSSLKLEVSMQEPDNKVLYIKK